MIRKLTASLAITGAVLTVIPAASAATHPRAAKPSGHVAKVASHAKPIALKGCRGSC
jgi:hypothetical protein